MPEVFFEPSPATVECRAICVAYSDNRHMILDGAMQVGEFHFAVPDEGDHLTELAGSWSIDCTRIDQKLLID